ncbi:MAG: class I SAM-dependent methyltransferase [Saccharospirillaceae bacterium]|nr:methyltransferase [Pseudomonadales bacterium]NRB79329.1 class I SAM-dependent methyltransferase [Saccharospirillaceae bacterium]
MQADELFEQLTLERYPCSSDASLTAFNQAESILVNRVLTDFGTTKLSIINENFGAISCVLHKQIVDQYNDSFLSNFGCELNLKNNNCDQTKPLLLDPSLLTGDLIIGLLPKSLSFFKWQLEQLSKLNKPVLIAGMVKYISSGHINLMNQYFEDTQVSRAHKKARCILLSQPKKQNSNNTIPKHEFNNIQVENLPGVFCQKHIDIGARFFIEQFKNIEINESYNIADLGCGNGILSLAMAKMYHKHSLNFECFDESMQAVKCAEHNWLLNELDKSKHSAAFIQNDGLLNQAPKKYDIIICNPPFHQNHTVGIHITQSLIKQAKVCLKDDGEFWLVANRTLPYLNELKSHFKCVNQVSQNAKFKVFMAKKT